MDHKMLTFVCATRDSRAGFESQSLLGRSLPQVAQMLPLRLCLFDNNSRPLGDCYNQAIDEAGPDDVLVFVHDDVSLDDWLCGWRVQEALLHFDVVGVAGNRRCQPGQSTWWLQPAPKDAQPDGLPWDHGQLSGAIRHLDAEGTTVSHYGPMPAPVVLLDGVFMAVRARTLQDSGVRFDPALGFHFYDLDFCRAATAAGLRLGTWPIAISHRSAGESMQSQAWRDSRALYWRKHHENELQP